MQHGSLLHKWRGLIVEEFKNSERKAIPSHARNQRLFSQPFMLHYISIPQKQQNVSATGSLAYGGITQPCQPFLNLAHVPSKPDSSCLGKTPRI